MFFQWFRSCLPAKIQANNNGIANGPHYVGSPPSGYMKGFESQLRFCVGSTSNVVPPLRQNAAVWPLNKPPHPITCCRLLSTAYQKLLEFLRQRLRQLSLILLLSELACPSRICLLCFNDKSEALRKMIPSNKSNRISSQPTFYKGPLFSRHLHKDAWEQISSKWS